MRDNIIKKIAFDSIDGRPAYMLIRIDHENHVIEFEECDGPKVHFVPLLQFLLSDRDVIKELNWADENWTRKNELVIDHYEGVSGCHDYRMAIPRAKHDWAKGDKFTQQLIYELHISCAGKLNEGLNDIFAGDLLDLLTYMATEWLNVKFDDRDNVPSNDFFEGLVGGKLFRYVKYHHRAYKPFDRNDGDFDFGL